MKYDRCKSDRLLTFVSYSILTRVAGLGNEGVSGLNPFWRFSYTFHCTYTHSVLPRNPCIEP